MGQVFKQGSNDQQVQDQDDPNGAISCKRPSMIKGKKIIEEETVAL